MGQEDTLADTDIAQADKLIAAPINDWCCMHHVLSLQDDFVNEKLLLQNYLEDCGHVCQFLPKFHCELNLIKMLQGYTQYHVPFHHCFVTLLTDQPIRLLNSI